MNRTYPTNLTPLFSSLAILSFKKKSKGSDLGGLSSSMDDLILDGENLSLSDLGGSVGSLSKLEKKDRKDKDSDFDDNILASIPTSGGRVDDRKFMEIEASVNDLKKHAESADLSSKATKGEIEGMKKDLSQINDSIRSLLNVYEAVSRQYNPFVEPDLPAANGKNESPKDEDLDLGSDISLGSLSSLDSLDKKNLSDIKAEAPEDDLGPLDRILKPDDPEEEEDFATLTKLDLESRNEEMPKVEAQPSEPEPVAEPKSVVKSRSGNANSIDLYALEQVHKLCEHQMSKIYRSRVIGEEPDNEDVEALERWMQEFKRLGGGRWG